MPFSAVFTLKAFVNGSVNIFHALIKRGKEEREWKRGNDAKAKAKAKWKAGKGEMRKTLPQINKRIQQQQQCVQFDEWNQAGKSRGRGGTRVEREVKELERGGSTVKEAELPAEWVRDERESERQMKYKPFFSGGHWQNILWHKLTEYVACLCSLHAALTLPLSLPFSLFLTPPHVACFASASSSTVAFCSAHLHNINFTRKPITHTGTHTPPPPSTTLMHMLCLCSGIFVICGT